MKHYRYKPGDRVMVRKDLAAGKVYSMNDHVCRDSAIVEMIPFAGKVVTIKHIFRDKYLIEEESSFWTDEMFCGFANVINIDPLF